MTPVENAVRALIQRNALHLKKGWRAAEVDWNTVITSLVNEIREFNVALSVISHAAVKRNECWSEEVEEELADIYGILVHAIIKAGYSVDEIEKRCLLKFQERFEHDTSTELLRVDSDGSCDYLPSGDASGETPEDSGSKKSEDNNTWNDFIHE